MVVVGQRWGNHSDMNTTLAVPGALPTAPSNNWVNRGNIVKRGGIGTPLSSLLNIVFLTESNGQSKTRPPTFSKLYPHLCQNLYGILQLVFVVFIPYQDAFRRL